MLARRVRPASLLIGNTLIIFTIIIAFSVLTPLLNLSGSITGAIIFDERNVSWENKTTITALPFNETITTHVLFGKYKPVNCSEGIAVFSETGEVISFIVQNETYANNSCIETDILFSNIIYNASLIKEPKNVTTEPSKNVTPPEINITTPNETALNESVEKPAPITAFIILKQSEIKYFVYYGKIPAIAEEEPEKFRPEAPVEEHPITEPIIIELPIIQPEAELVATTIEERTTTPVEINKPARWTKRVKFFKASDLIVVSSGNETLTEVLVEIPASASDILIKDIASDTKFTPDRVLVDSQNKTKELRFFESILPNEEKEFEVEYETPGPESTEKQISPSIKQVTIYSDVHYTNVLAYTDIPEANTQHVELYHVVGGQRIPVTDFEYIDTDDNNLSDRIQWIVPHLSNETYELNLTILNPWESVAVGDDWVVYFNTTGTAKLNITKDDKAYEVLEFNNLKCGDIEFDPIVSGPSIIVYNWNCDEQTASINHTKVSDKYNLFSQKFEFGEGNETIIEYAYDPLEGNCVPAGGGECDGPCGGPGDWYFDDFDPPGADCYTDPACTTPCGASGGGICDADFSCCGYSEGDCSTPDQCCEVIFNDTSQGGCWNAELNTSLGDVCSVFIESGVNISLDNATIRAVIGGLNNTGNITIFGGPDNLTLIEVAGDLNLSMDGGFVFYNNSQFAGAKMNVTSDGYLMMGSGDGDYISVLIVDSGATLKMGSMGILAAGLVKIYGTFDANYYGFGPSAVPDSQADIIVYNSAYFLGRNDSVVINDLSVQSGGTFNATTATIEVYGDIQINGTFNHSKGTIKLVGAQDNYIRGTQNLTFHNLEFSKTSADNVQYMNTNITIKNNLTISNGSFASTNGNTLTVNGDVSFTGTSSQLQLYAGDPVVYLNGYTYMRTGDSSSKITIWNGSIHGLRIRNNGTANMLTNLSYINATDVEIWAMEHPQDDSDGFHNVSAYINISNRTSTGSSIAYVELSYSDSDVIGVTENTLRLWRYNGTGWEVIPDSAVDTVNNIIYGNITTFSGIGGGGNSSSCTTGDDCGSDICIEGTCYTQCEADKDGQRCSDDSNTYDSSGGGVCARDYGGTYICDKDEVARYSGLNYSDCYEPLPSGPTADLSCDSDVGPGFTQDGMCTYSTGDIDIPTVNCDSSEACHDDSMFRDDCSRCSVSPLDVDNCTSGSLSSGYSANGYCTLGGICSTGTVYQVNGTTLSDGCSDGGGEACDSDATGSENGAWASYADGVCVSGSTCEVGDVYYDDEGGVYYNSPPASSLEQDQDPSGDSCDSDVDGSGYARDGMIVQSGGSLNTNCDAFGGVVRADASAGYDYVTECDSSGDACDSSTANSDDPWAADGICASSTCDADDVALVSSTYYSCGSNSDGYRCDTDTSTGSFSQDSMCLSDTNNGGAWDCKTTGHACYDGTYYEDTCASCGVADGCTSTLTSGDFSASGICLSDNSCDETGEAAKDCSYAEADCSNYYASCGSAGVNDNDRCDTDITNGAYSDDGVCSGGNCVACTGSETSCYDGIDNDCDGDIDGYDTDCECTITGTQTLSSNLDCSGEPLNITSSGFLIAGIYNITADNATIAGNLTSTTGFFNITQSAGMTVTSTGNVTAGSGTDWLGSLTINAGGRYNATSGTTTITSENPSGFALDCDGTFTANSGLVNITTPTNTIADITCTGNLYDLEVAMGGSNELRINNDDVIDNDLTVSSGIVANNYYSTSLTVTGDVIISGTLKGGVVPQTFGSITINSGGTYEATSGTTTITSRSTVGSYVFDNAGTFVNNSGTIKITTTSEAFIRNAGTGNFHNLWLKETSTNALNMNSDIIIDNDFIIEGRGQFKSGTTKRSLTVTGDVVINYTGDGNAILGDNSETQDWSFGSLTIGSGNEYRATSGVTTITNNFNKTGTFTHNSGTLDVGGTIYIKSGSLVASPITYAGAIDIASGTTLNLTAGTTLNFTSTTGFGSSSGTLNASGTDGNWVTITGDAANPWMSSNNLNWYARYMTAENHNRIRVNSGGSVDINTAVFDNASFAGFQFDGNPTVINFKNIVINNSQDGLIPGTEATLTNITILNSIDDDIDFQGVSQTPEFIDSSFDLNKVALTSTASIISENHNDIAGSYQILATDLTKSSITNSFDSNDNVTIYTGNFTLDQADWSYASINVTANANLTYTASNTDVGVNYWKVSGGKVYVTGSNTLTSNTSYFNGAQLNDNTTGVSYWIDSVSAGSSWIVNGFNQAPTLESKELYPNSPYTADNLWFDANCTDPDIGDTLTVYWNTWKNGVNQTNLAGSKVVTSGVNETVYTILSGNTSKGEQWKVQVWCSDGTETTAKSNTSTRTIQNSAPSTPTSLTPTSGTYGGTQNIISITCSGSTDPDGDDVDWNIEGYYDGSWNLLVFRDEDGSYDWDISSLSTQTGVDIRCNATDGNLDSDYYNPSGTFNIDNTAPQWSNPIKNATTVYQNKWVTFNATWTEADNQLAGYIFSLNQSGQWVNSSYVSFSGTLANSTNTSYITAAAGTVVEWKFYANDTLGNMNETAKQSFTVQNKSIAIALSDELNAGITWNISSLPAIDANATGNNNAGNTDYYVVVNSVGTNVDLYIKADTNLTTGSQNVSLKGERYAYSTSDQSVPAGTKTRLYTFFYNSTINNTIGTNLANNSYSYLKFFLNVSGGQGPGLYKNNITIKGVEYEALP